MIWMNNRVSLLHTTNVFGSIFRNYIYKDGAAIRKFASLEPTTGKDILLYKHDKPKFYKYLNVFAMVQFFLWSSIAHLTIRSLRNTPVPTEPQQVEGLPWWKKFNLGEAKYKTSLSAICYLFGGSILAGSWLFTLRSVRYLILNKGGCNVSLVTYAPFGENRIYTIPLEKMSCSVSRSGAKWTLPIRVYGYRFHFLLDMSGEFRHAELFDKTAGVLRKF